MTKEEALQNKIEVQEKTVQSWFMTGWGCAELATGVGKTKVALDCIKALRAMNPALRTLVIVPTEEMRDVDWPEEANAWETSLENVKIVCYAALSKVDLSLYDFIVYDECHRLTTPHLRKLEHVRLKGTTYMLGLTATLPKTAYDDSDSLERLGLLLELFPVVYKVSTDDAVELGLISDFHVHVLLFDLDTTHKIITAGTKASPFLNTEAAQYRYLTTKLQRATIMAQQDKRKEGFRFAAISARTNFLYNLPSKYRLASLCLNRLRESPTRTVVFAGSIEQAEALCGKDVYHSKSNRDSLENFQQNVISLLGAVKCLNEGKNLHRPDNGLIVQVDSVDRNLVQRIGRLVRIRYDDLTHKAQIVILVARGTADEKWYQSAIKDFDSKRITQTLVKVPDPV